MKKFLLPVIAVMATGIAMSQPGMRSANSDSSWKKIYRATPAKEFDLLHTKVDVRFDYTKRRMPGKVWLTLKPHIYAKDSLVLDAKGMLINKVALLQGTISKPLSFSYPDTLQLRIALDKMYKPTETFTIYIEYVARPDEMTFAGSAAIRNAKGLYFINPDGKDTTKPIQIWTQGETEATSVWVPILDKNNQKTTQEMYMTVPAKYVTLSNGLLKSSIDNKDGTRTDYWKMDLPHSPYLFFMGVGDFAIIHDKYKTIPVDYYVEPKYAPVARKIFGLTPEMIGFFSQLLGVEYPWAKYAQMVGRDYVSGAMENTTATLHGSRAYQKSRALADENIWESTVAHELFHQWFGDYVTAESWSNLTVNETMANYSQTLWYEHKYGKDFADEENNNDLQKYLSSRSAPGKNLVRFYYADKEDMFDVVSYEKGGRIQHMLRNYIGDSAYFKGLNLYLTANKFKNGEAHQLRLAFEEASGKDLTWYFNQWYYGAGHPEVQINYEWIDSVRQEKVVIKQRQQGQIFQFPLAIDVYNGSQKVRQNVWVKDTVSSFYLPAASEPSQVSVDADKIMLWRKQDSKPATWYVQQYNNGSLYMDRKEALDSITAHFDSSDAERAVMVRGLSDRYHTIRQIALRFWRSHTAMMTNADEEIVYATAQNFYHNPTRALAIDVLGKRGGKKYETLLKKSTTDSSYSVAGAALEALINSDVATANVLQPALNKDADGRLKTSLLVLTYINKSPSEADSVAAAYKRMGLLERLTTVKPIMYYLLNITDVNSFKQISGPIVEAALRPNPFDATGAIRNLMMENINWMLDKKKEALAADANNTALQEQIQYVKDKLAAK